MKEDLRNLLGKGEEIISVIEEITIACLRNLESLTGDEIEKFLLQRHQLVRELNTLITDLGKMSASHHRDDLEESTCFEQFRKSFRASSKRIIEADGLIRALTEKEMMTIKGELDTISQGRKAIIGYRGRERRKLPSVDRIA